MATMRTPRLVQGPGQGITQQQQQPFLQLQVPRLRLPQMTQMTQIPQIPQAPPAPPSPWFTDQGTWTSLPRTDDHEAEQSREQHEPEVGHIPLLEDEILIDDENATMVLVFPRGSEDGGTVMVDAVIESPLEMAMKVFVRPQNVDSHHAWEDSFSAFKGGPVSAKVYQEVCRSVFLEILVKSGLHAESFSSIDNDECFLKISMNRGGEVIRQLAQRYQYRMPFSVKAYSEMEAQGVYEGHRPMSNSEGQMVPAYTEFEFELAEHLQRFRDVDEIRLIERLFDEWVNVSELLNQNIISKIFVGAKHDAVLKLHEEWGSLRRLAQIPSYEHEDDIRDYFGEEIAFFFFWFAFYARMLAPLGLLGFGCYLSNLPFFNLSLTTRRTIQVAFAFVLVTWASVYNELFKNRDARAKQRWGMKDFDTLAVERAQYDPNLEGTWRLLFQRHFANVAVVFACVGFVGAVTATELWKKAMLEAGNKQIAQYGALTTVLLIKVTSFGWSKIAPKLADAQNHRTQMRWNDALTWILTLVKLFVALFPFVNLTFLKKYTSPTCEVSLQEAAWKIYGQPGWPTGVAAPRGTDANSTALSELGWLSGFHYSTGQGHECVYGCFPVSCSDPIGGAANCVTNCAKALEEELLAVYGTHVISTVIFLLIPIILTKWSVHQEIVKSQDAAGSDGESREENGEGARHRGKVSYSFMQFQAKCYDQARYEYASWGGSQVEDFLELAIGFALLTCFGILVPVMSLLAFVAHVVEYRLLAYRMTNVTCRPMPHGAEGIGSWQFIFEGISFLAVAINVGIAVFVLRPMTAWHPAHQFGAFIVLEHAMLFLKVVVAGAIPDEPHDVQRIEDFNARFKAKFVKRTAITVPQEEQCPIHRVDIGLTSPL